MSNKPDHRAEEIAASGTAVGVLLFGLYMSSLAFFTWYDGAWPDYGFFLLNLLHALIAEVNPAFADHFCAGVSALIGVPVTFYTARFLASPPESAPKPPDDHSRR